MRTTVDLPDEIFQSAQKQAAQRGLEVNEFIAAVVVKGVNAGLKTDPSPSPVRPRSQLPTIKGKGRWKIPDLTPELEARLQDQDDLVSYHRSFGR